MEKPNVFQRARLAMQVFSRGVPRQIALPGETKAVPFLWPSYQEGQPAWHIVDLASYIEEGFNVNSLIYSAVMYKARAVTAAPLRAYEGDVDHPDPLKASAPLTRLLARPNPHMAWAALQQAGVIFLNVAGNSYVFCERPARKAPPQALWPLRPDRVHIVPAKGGILGYLYVPEGKSLRDAMPILPEDMIHVKFANPSDPFEGMGEGLSPISAMAYSADVDNAITHFLKLFFDHGAMPQGVLSYDVAMKPEVMARARERWMEVYGGYTNWAEIAVLDSGGKYERAGLTFEEMGFGEIDERNEARILGPFGVPAALIGARIGLRSASVSANVGELRRVFWEDTMLAELRLFEDEIGYHLNTEEGQFVKYDISGVPALRRDLSPLVDAAYKLWSMGVPANAAVAAVGVDVGEIPGGDTGYLPATVMPVGATPTAASTEQGQATATGEERGPTAPKAHPRP